MKILFLYNNKIALDISEWLEKIGLDVICASEQIDSTWCHNLQVDLTISYTYRYILTPDIIESLNNNVVNIHTSYLPWNRGADPNIWSILDETPRGVTLHYIDVKLDHGDIIAQVLLPSESTELVENEYRNAGNHTLTSTYNELDRAAKELFKTAFSYYPYWDSMRKSSMVLGSYHRSSELVEFKRRIGSYDVGVDDARKIYREMTNRKLSGGGYFSSLKGENLVTAYQSGIIRRCA